MSEKIPEYLRTLNEQQRKAVEHDGSPLLILAGAGSGKTRVITTKIAWLIDRMEYDPRSILAVTFTNRAASEMMERVHQMVEGSSGVIIRTFHSFGAWLLRRNGAQLGLSSSFSIYDDEDSLSLLHSIYGDRNKRDLKPYAHWISRAKDYALLPDDDAAFITHDPEFPEVYRAYQQRLDEVGNVDFGDLILKPVTLLEHYTEVRERIRQRFRVVLVDEYQDSNVAQFKLLQQLFGKDTYLCVVGDDDQSIYRFRGAEVRNILEFPERFSGTEIIRLEQNYRSTQNILSIASAVVDNNRDRLGKSLWTRNGEGTPASLVYLNDQKEEAEYCARLLNDGNLDGTAILYRTNAQSREFEILFNRIGIPYRLVGTVAFYSREEIKDAMAWLHLVHNSRDEIAWRRVINKPTRGIGKGSMEKILAHRLEAKGDMIEATSISRGVISSKAAGGAEKFLNIYENLRNSLRLDTLGTFLITLLTETGLLEYYKEQDISSGTQRLNNLEELVGAAADYPPGEEGLAEFLEDIELDRLQTEEEESDTRDRVTLITMHNTKGLEFDRVIITGMEDGLFPSRRDSFEDDLEEERRIFYVSITRARKELYLTACRYRRIWGKTQMMFPSPFLGEIPASLLESEGEAAPEDEDSEFSPGTRVYHDSYGSGTVQRAYSDGYETAVEIRFDSGRSGRFIPEFSPLERIADDDFI